MPSLLATVLLNLRLPLLTSTTPSFWRSHSRADHLPAFDVPTLTSGVVTLPNRRPTTAEMNQRVPLRAEQLVTGPTKPD